MAVALIGTVLAGGVAAKESAPAGGYIVVFEEDVTRAAAETTSREEELGFEADYVYGRAVDGFAADLTAEQREELAADPDVDFIDRNRPVSAISADSPPLMPGEPLPPTGVRRIGAATENTTREASGVGVAVLDTGVDLDHPDLNAADGTNCISPGKPAEDVHTHGTHVAGTIAARNNGTGVVGVAPDTQIWSVKVLGDSGSGTWASVICGIDWVTANAESKGIRVANMSLGGSGEALKTCETTTDAHHLAICRSTAAGVNYTVAAGNDYESFDSSWLKVPALYPEVLTVTAVADSDGQGGGIGGSPSCRGGQDDAPADFSNWAATPVGQSHTIAGPGVCIKSSVPGGGTGVKSGTSMAAPHLAGEVALCINEGGRPGPCAGMSPAQVIQHMRAQAEAATTEDPAFGFLRDPLHSPTNGRYYGFMSPAPPTAPEDGLPNSRITKAPPSRINHLTPSFEFEADEPDATFACRLDSDAFAPCSGPGRSHTPAPLAEGAHRFEVLATAADGRAERTPARAYVVVDLTPPLTTLESGPSGPINTRAPRFTFSSNEAGHFECSFDEEPFSACSATSNHTGTALPDGDHVFQVRAVDQAGNADESPASRAFRIDATPPETAITGGPAEGSTVKDALPRFDFEAGEEGATFRCSIDSTSLSHCSGPGRTHAPANALDEGTHTFRVTATDASGNTDPTPAIRTFTIGGFANTTILPGPSSPTSDSTPTHEFVADEPGVTFLCRLIGAEYKPCSDPRGAHTPEPLADGSYKLSVKAVDGDGGIEPVPAERSFQVDTKAPETKWYGTPPAISGPSVRLNVDSDDYNARFECSLDGGPWASCGYYDYWSLSNLADGEHVAMIRAVDTAGNRDETPLEHRWRVDAVAPETRFSVEPASPTADSTPTFEFESNESGVRYECSLNGSSFSACSGPDATHTTEIIDDAPHQFRVVAIDAAGNRDKTPATADFVVDSPRPQTTIKAGPNGPTRDSTPTFEFESDEPGSSFVCRIGTGSFDPCLGPPGTHTPVAPLIEGNHSFEVRAIDVDGDRDMSAAQRTFTVDTVPPDTEISSLTVQKGATAYINFRGLSGGSTFECRIDAGEWARCSTGYTTPALGSGAHTFEVRSIDAAGNTDPSPASRVFEIDATPPETTITGSPDPITADETPTFTFSSNEEGSTFKCKLQYGSFYNCTGPGASHTPQPLTEGAHRFEVYAIDKWGNVDPTPAAFDFVVRTDRPDTTIVDAPDLTSDPTPEFSFDSDKDGASFECRIDGGAFGACSGARTHTPSSPLWDGNHSFEVRARVGDRIDLSPARVNFEVDTRGPNVTVEGPFHEASLAGPWFRFSSNEPVVEYLCAIDDAALRRCAGPDGHYQADVNAEGSYTLYVAAIDAAGNTSPWVTPRWFSIRHSFSIQPQFVGGGSWPYNWTTDPTPTFTWTSDLPLPAYECALDEGQFKRCSGPGSSHTPDRVPDGRHQLHVRGLDAAGRRTETVSSYTFRVDTVPPQTTTGLPSERWTYDRSPSVSFTGSHGTTSYRCRTNGGPWQECDSGWVDVDKSLRDGRYVFEGFAIDAAGNADPTPAKTIVNIDSVKPDTKLVGKLPKVVRGRTLKVRFDASERVTHYHCQVARAPRYDCQSPVTLRNLKPGQYWFEVAGVDRTDRADDTPARFEFVVAKR